MSSTTCCSSLSDREIMSAILTYFKNCVTPRPPLSENAVALPYWAVVMTYRPNPPVCAKLKAEPGRQRENCHVGRSIRSARGCHLVQWGVRPLEGCQGPRAHSCAALCKRSVR